MWKETGMPASWIVEPQIGLKKQRIPFPMKTDHSDFSTR